MHPEQLWSEHRRRKAPLVLHMLATQCGRSDEGERGFARLLSTLCLFPAGAPSPPRIDSTAALLKACRGVSSADLSLFFRQWVYEARPPPTLRANFAYNRRAFKVELVLQQSEAGSEEATLRGCVLGIQWGEADREGDGSYAQCRYHPLNQPMELVELDVDARRKRSKRRRGSRADGDEGEDGPEVVVTGREAGSSVPLLWLRLDPDQEWVARVVWTGRPDEPRWSGQPEFMCREQLEHDKDVASQCDAVGALSTFVTHSAVEALHWCVLDANYYYRVRAEAAASLSRLAGAELEDNRALARLFQLLRERAYHEGQVAPNDFANLAEYHVLKALVEAVGACKDAAGVTPPEALELLLELLDDNDNSQNEYDDGHYLGALLLLLGGTHSTDAEDTAAIVSQVRRHLQLDRLVHSPQGVLTRCGLQALAALELAGRRAPEWPVYFHYAQHGASPLVRLAAAECLLRLCLLLPAAPAAAAAAARPSLAQGGTLGLALRLAEERAAAPLEELWLWQALLRLLHHALPGDKGKKKLEAELDAAGEAGEAAVQLLWLRLCHGSGHARLRFTLCEVWRACFGAAAAPRAVQRQQRAQPISHAQTHPSYTPPYLVAQSEEHKQQSEQRDEKHKSLQHSMKLNLSRTGTGAIVHSRHNHLDARRAALPGGGGGGGPGGAGAPLPPRPRFFESIAWHVQGARDPRVADAAAWVEYYRQSVERSLVYSNSVLSRQNSMQLPPPAQPQNQQPPQPASQPQQPLMLKLGRASNVGGPR